MKKTKKQKLNFFKKFIKYLLKFINFKITFFHQVILIFLL